MASAMEDIYSILVTASWAFISKIFYNYSLDTILYSWRPFFSGASFLWVWFFLSVLVFLSFFSMKTVAFIKKKQLAKHTTMECYIW